MVDIDGAVQLDATFTVGTDGSGQDVVLYSGTAGDNLTWDASAEALIVTGTNGQTALNVADGNLVVADNIDLAADIDVDGTANLDAVDIDGAVQIDATLSVGVDDTGYDVKLFGATSGAYIEWDESDDELRTAGGAVIDVVKDKFLIGGTAVTATASELNLLDNVSGLVQADLTKLAAIDASATELNILDASARTTSTHDMEGNDYDFTVNAPQQSVTITLNTNLTDNSDLSELTITNSSILAITSGLVFIEVVKPGTTPEVSAIRGSTYS